MTIKVEYRQKGSGSQYDFTGPLRDGYSHALIWDGKSAICVKCCNELCKSYYYLDTAALKFKRGTDKVKTGMLSCQGCESSSKGRVIYRNCANYLLYRFSRVEDRPENESE